MLKKSLIIPVFLLIVLMSGVVLMASGQEEQEAYEATFISRDDLGLTIYDDGTVLVRDVRTFDLEAGLNRVEFPGISHQLLYYSLTFQSLSNPATYILEQELMPGKAEIRATQAAPLNLQTIMAQNIGETVRFTHTDGTVYEGILLSIEPQIILQQGDGTLIPFFSVDDIRAYEFASVPDVIIPEKTNEVIAEAVEPGLSLLINSPEAGEQQLVISYLMQGISWSTHYNLQLAADNKSLDITGWITFQNFTDITFEDAHVTLVAGDYERLAFVSRESASTGSVGESYAATEEAYGYAMTATPSPSSTPSSTYQTYQGGGSGRVEMPEGQRFLHEFASPMTLPAYQGHVVEFLADAEMEARNIFVYDVSPRVYGYSGFITSSDYGQTEVSHVVNILEFAIKDDNIDLPPGNMLIYQERDNESLLLVGNAPLPYTPAGETVQIYLDSPEDITAERTQVEFQSLSQDAVQEAFEIRLRNRSDEDIEVLVVERMTRSPNWEILGSSMPYEQPNSFGIEFLAEVPAGEDVVVSYTVLYTRPQ